MQQGDGNQLGDQVGERIRLGKEQERNRKTKLEGGPRERGYVCVCVCGGEGHK